jgi:Carbohydrate esterase, sialic acid-specific acetylesterase
MHQWDKNILPGLALAAWLVFAFWMAGRVDGDTLVPPNMIAYIGIGHCNMAGNCGAIDTVPHPRVWSYRPAKGFYNCTDRDISGGATGGPLMPFLKEMALRYPRYNFCGLKIAGPGKTASGFLTESMGEIETEIGWMKGRAIIGGVIMMFGTAEAKEKEKADAIGTDMIRLLNTIRDKTSNPALPIIIGRYAGNGPERMVEYQQHENVATLNLDSLPIKTTYALIAPVRDVPGEYYCDPAATEKKSHDYHVYACEGYEIFARDAVTEIQWDGLDFWYKEK